MQPSYLTQYAWQFLTDTFKEKNLVDIKQLLIEARAIKTPWEIEVLREAAHYSELTMNKGAKSIVPGMTEADVLQLFNTTAFSWSPDIIDVANAHTIGENFTSSFIPPHTRINRGDIIRLDGGNVIEQGPPEEIFVSPTQERTRQFLSRYLPEFTYNI